jgi:hypothetical protein
MSYRIRHFTVLFQSVIIHQSQQQPTADVVADCGSISDAVQTYNYGMIQDFHVEVYSTTAPVPGSFDARSTYWSPRFTRSIRDTGHRRTSIPFHEIGRVRRDPKPSHLFLFLFILSNLQAGYMVRANEAIMSK